METAAVPRHARARSERARRRRARPAGLDAAVPSCPGWTVTDLLDHCVRGDALGADDRRAGQAGSTDRVLPATPTRRSERRRAGRRVPRRRAGARRRRSRSVDPDTSVWTFSSTDRTAAFWQRRRSQETAVHRYDAELAAGDAARRSTPRSRSTASTSSSPCSCPGCADNFGAVGDGTVHLHCTDVDGEWLSPGATARSSSPREHAKGDVAARGSASDLLLFLWGRVPADSLEVFGDADAARAVPRRQDARV